MKEYIIVSVTGIIIVFILDQFLKTCLFKNRKFWIFQIIAVLLTTLVDNYSSGKPIVVFNESYLLNMRIFSVPLENYLFGFCLLSLNLILFEFLNRRKNVG